MASGSRPSKVHFLNNAMLPCSVGFCMDDDAWEREMRRIKLPKEERDKIPESSGLTVFITGSQDCVYVKISGWCSRTDVEVIGLIAHESAHVFDEIANCMKEKEPSSEFKAYTVQWLVQNFYLFYLEAKKNKKAKKVKK